MWILPRRSVIVCCAAVVVAGLCVAPEARAQGWPATKLAPYVTSPMDVAEKMLRMANVRKGDVVYDLGAGDGRIVILAAQEFGAKAVGVEIDKDLCRKAEKHIEELKLQDKAQMVCGDMMNVDLSDATVVTLYLTTTANSKLRPNLEKYLRKGARIVSHSFGIPGWLPVRTEAWRGPSTRDTLYLYSR